MAKILECQGCGTWYESPPDFPEEGRKVRCAKCGQIWHAMAVEAEAEPEPEPEGDSQDEADVAIQWDEVPSDIDPEAPADDESDLERLLAETDDIDEIDFAPEDGEAEDSDEIEAAAAADESPAQDAPEDTPGDVSEDVPKKAVAAEPEPEPEPDPEPDPEPLIEEPEPEAEVLATEEPPEVETVEEPVPEPLLPTPPREPSGFRITLDGVALGWMAFVISLLGLGYVAYEKRVTIVRALPGIATAYELAGVPVNIRGLSFGPVAHNWTVESGRPILEVEGEIRNITDRTLKVPTVVFALRNKAEVEVYQWAADVRNEPLPGGQRTLFLARIPSPPKSIESVQVRFARSR